MYLGFYKLQEMPFRLAPDPRFMFWSAGHAAAFAGIRAVRNLRDGCAIIIGERGAGKTGLLEYLRQDSSAQSVPRLDFPPRTLSALREWLRDINGDDRAGGGRIILCDNAHLFHESMLAALLQEASGAHAHAPATCVVMAGEPELARTFEKPELATLGTRRCERLHLPPLTPAEVATYIAHRLKIAGANGKRIFRDEVFAEVHRQTNGNPRLVNALCDSALMVACERELPEVGSSEVSRALEDVGRLVALQADEPEAYAPLAPPDGQAVAASSRDVFARLRLMRAGQLVLERELARGSLCIGRSSDNELCIESRYVSRQHCRIVTDERRCVLEDVNSTNGLYVNDKRVRRHRLRNGDVVRVGEHRMHYVDLREHAGSR